MQFVPAKARKLPVLARRMLSHIHEMYDNLCIVHFAMSCFNRENRHARVLIQLCYGG